MRRLYILTTYLLAPLVLASLLWRGFRNRGYWHGLGQRFGRVRPTGAAGTIWLHAVSVGEVQASLPLVRALLEKYPQLPLVVTTVTPTGRERVLRLFGEQVTHLYAPYDLPGVVKRFFDQVQPVAAIVMETELWPNLFHECGRRGVPLILASARISPRSVGRYRRFLPLFRDALAHGIVIAAQSKRDAERFLALGASPQRTHVVGNIKFDLEDNFSGGSALQSLGPVQQRPIWIAASTHEGEEQAALQAAARIAARAPRSLLILAPRHPERFEAVAQQVTRSGLKCARRSKGETCTATTQVFLLDTLGELPDFFNVAQVAFVGGSLVPVGGHNLLEPAAAAIPVLTGPHTFNAPDIADQLIAEEAAFVVHDEKELAGFVLRFLESEALREESGRRARQVIEANRGSTARLLALIEPLLDLYVAGIGRQT